jgi:hypothetical protein
MAFKTISSVDAETTTALGGFNKKTKKDNPTQVEGYYLGNKKVDSPKAKSGFAYLHVFQTAKGNLGVWGKTDMDKKLLSIPTGTMTRVTFAGTKPTKSGNDMYVYTVEADDDNTIEVTGTDSTNTSADYDSATDEDDNTQQAALLAAERLAKVQELLAKGKKA